MIALLLYCALLYAQHAQWCAVQVPLGESHLANCAAVQNGFRCSMRSSESSAVTLPISLKAHHDYAITIAGRSLTRDPVHLYVEFDGADYDAATQKGELRLFPGAMQRYVLRWPSDLPPQSAWLRFDSADPGEYEIETPKVTRASKAVTWISDTVGCLALLLVLRAFIRTDIACMVHHVRSSMARMRERHPLVALALIVGGVCIMLLMRVATLSSPIVFGDEMSYALLAQSLGNPAIYSRNEILQPLPNQLFFDVYHLATLAGEATLGFARALNCALFALAAVPIFALGRRLLPRREALLFAAAALLLPNNVYTGFFMPESFYFLGFYVVAWAFFSFIAPEGRLRHAVVAGVALAALSLIKPHGLTIMLGCNLTLLVGMCAWRGERVRLAKGWVSLLVAFCIARAVLGISDAPHAEGPWLQRTFGLYAGFITNTLHVALDAQTLARLALAAANNFGSMLLLFGAPLALSIAWLCRRKPDTQTSEDKRLARLHLFTYLTVLCLLLGTIKFTAYIAGADWSQDPARIHERYYDFSFTLLLLCGYASARALVRDVFPRRAILWPAAALVVVCGLWYVLRGLPELAPSWVDHATLLGVWTWHVHSVFVIALFGPLLAALVPFAPRRAWHAYVAFMTFTAIGGFAAILDQAAVSRQLGENDRSMLALKALYGPRELEHGLVISNADNIAPLCHTAFALRNNTTMRLLPLGSIVQPAVLAPDAQWVLTYGEYRLDGEGWSEGLLLPANATLYRRIVRRK